MSRNGHASVGRARRRSGGDEKGQALVEFALVLPLVILLVAVAFNGWNGIQLAVRLTSAARAGAVQAANDLGADVTAHPGTPPTALEFQNAWDAATSAVNQEEGVTGVYQDKFPNQADYVNMPAPYTQSLNGVGTVGVVTVTITQASVTLVPVVGNFSVSAHAAARYS